MVKKWWQTPKLTWLMFSFLALPASTNYKLEGFSLGNAGGEVMESSSYEMVGNVGELSSTNLSGESYNLGAGLAWVRQSNVPPAPAVTNPDNYYNRLHLVINQGDNPADTKYAIAISTDNFATTQYVKNDHTVGTTLALTDYQTYTEWGATTGIDIIGLIPSTTYSVKAKAMQGKFTETSFGPFASAATVDLELTFDIDVSASDAETASPYTISLGDLTPGSVKSSTEKIWVDVGTNAANGASVFVYGQNGGLYSLSAGSTIAALSGDLSALPKGFGSQGVGTTQNSGGPINIASPYNTSNDVVGITDTTIRPIFLSENPVSAGRARFLVKAKVDITTPTADDYSETLTVIAAANY